MKNYRRFLVAAALGAFIAPAWGCAASDSGAPPPLEGQDKFTVMDADADGKVTLEEFTTANPNMNERAFVIIDRNGDKAIAPEEWAVFIETHGQGTGGRPMGAPMNNIPGDPLIPPPDSDDLPLVRPPMN